MKQIFSFFVVGSILLVLSGSVPAQNSSVSQTKNVNSFAASVGKQQEAMKKLDFLVGNWRGNGWIMLGANKRETFTIDETVQTKLDGLIVLIEGVGKNDDRIVHNALGLLSYDAEKQKYVWEAFTKMGNRVETAPEISLNKFVWGFSNPQIGGEVRYTITLNEKGNWHEIGEFSRDGGKTWFKNFEMELQKVK